MNEWKQEKTAINDILDKDDGSRGQDSDKLETLNQLPKLSDLQDSKVDELCLLKVEQALKHEGLQDVRSNIENKVENKTDTSAEQLNPRSNDVIHSSVNETWNNLNIEVKEEENLKVDRAYKSPKDLIDKLYSVIKDVNLEIKDFINVEYGPSTKRLNKIIAKENECI